MIENTISPGDIVRIKSDDGTNANRMTVDQVTEDELRKQFMARLAWVDRSGAVQVCVLSTAVLVKA